MGRLVVFFALQMLLFNAVGLQIRPNGNLRSVGVKGV